ncbi:hypothetical protein ACIBCB_08895 [Streptomyces uncialis]|uniref:hypothetical protein n=1 Tax=Streptomyces uncialis TaxID=1048205 RepID=UPI0037A50BA2
MPASIREEGDHLLALAVPRGDGILPGRPTRSLIDCPSCGSTQVAQLLGDNGGVSFMCTACGHSWS